MPAFFAVLHRSSEGLGLALALASADCSTPTTPWHGRPGHNLCTCSRNVDSGYSGILRIPGHTPHILSRKGHIVGERIRYFGPYMPQLACILPSNQRQALRILPSSLRLLLLGKRRSIGRTPGRSYSIRGYRFHIESSSWRSPMEWGVSAHIPGSTFHAASPVTSLLKRRGRNGRTQPSPQSPTLYSVSLHLRNVAPRSEASFLGSLRTSYRTRLAVTARKRFRTWLDLEPGTAMHPGLQTLVAASFQLHSPKTRPWPLQQ
ncbi:hypothetical protein SAMN05428937_0344 [Achromobacter sp. MFA1 R4]|nr:hypothetical protein SAMN05428937_0344 [Achromobacter sp. MFA1 R4]